MGLPSWGGIRYKVMRAFHGERKPDSLYSDMLQLIRFSGKVPLETLYQRYGDRASKDVIRATASNLKSEGLVGRDDAGNYIPATPTSVLSYRFGVRLASVAVPFAAIIYAASLGDGYFFAFAMLMLALSLGELVNTAFG